MKTATLQEITAALVKVMGKTVGKGAVIVSPWQEGDPDTKEILVIYAVKPGQVSGGELGGPSALSVLSGVYNVTLSYPRNSSDKADASWALAQKLCEAFYRQDLPVADGCRVYAGAPYTTNVGTTPDGRKALAVAIPWRVWTGGYQED